MEQFVGKALYFQQLKNADLKNTVNKIVFSQKNCGAELGEVLCSEDFSCTAVVALSFSVELRQALAKKNIMTIELDKLMLEDIFRIFSAKDTDCTIKKNEDGSAKIKLVSGSLSKSFCFKIDQLVAEFLK
ncbi:MAG: hypothetical protein NC041_03580 [Bacteroides sp.]|nr:hypothetical protein [Prevotella sp.]MCM1408205.1 hypothetical protein [Treponema brennaborense]MCM1469529.1 hypothetical protein [Bacteroides sp.]